MDTTLDDGSNSVVFGTPDLHGLVAATSGSMPNPWAPVPAPVPRSLIEILPGLGPLRDSSDGKYKPSLNPGYVEHNNFAINAALETILDANPPNSVHWDNAFYLWSEDTNPHKTTPLVVDGANVLSSVTTAMNELPLTEGAALLACAEFFRELVSHMMAARGVFRDPDHVVVTFMSDQNAWPRCIGAPAWLTDVLASEFFLNMARLTLFPYTVSVVTLNKEYCSIWYGDVVAPELDDALCQAMAVDFRDVCARGEDFTRFIATFDKYDWRNKPVLHSLGHLRMPVTMDFVLPSGDWFRNDKAWLSWDFDWSTSWTPAERASHEWRLRATRRTRGIEAMWARYTDP